MQAGSRLGHFEILSALGSGGMGEVWKARDTKLQREVAIKTLPSAFAADEERLTRLEREATSLAAVNHANIASIHGLEEDEGTRFLVLELVDGMTLAERLQNGPLPMAEALETALQVASALEAAHGRGVIHRDLKPANVMITSDHVVKVLDFGLAKSLEPAAAKGSSFDTEVGTVLGTASYMSPEQARGEAAGRQADIWSFGVMLYEMLTGASPFERPSKPETLAHVLVSEVDHDALPPGTPPSARHLIRRCLEKEPKRRLKDMGDVRIGVEDALAELSRPRIESEKKARATSTWRIGVAAAFAVGVLTAAGGVGVWSMIHPTTPNASGPVVHLALPALGPRSRFPYGSRSIAITNDGSRIAYAAWSELLIRRLDDGGTTRVAMNNANARGNPFFSPNGEWLGYSTGDRLQKVRVTGGTPQMIAMSTERPAGASWGSDGTIVFATTSGLYAVPDNASAPPRQLVAPDRDAGERLYAWPQFLPDGRSVLFTIVPEDPTNASRAAVVDLDSLELSTVLRGASSARYVASGHLVYANGDALSAIEFDPAARAVRGEPIALPNLSVDIAADNGAAELAVSETGTLISIAPVGRTAPSRLLTWVDHEDKEEALALPPDYYVYPRISPDGTRIAYELGQRDNRDIYIYDLRRQSQTRLTTGPTEDMLALWSRDGTRIYFSSDRSGNFDIYSQPADGSTDARVELARSEFETPRFEMPSGRELLVYEEFHDISVLDLEQREVRPLLQGEFTVAAADVSPDGRWIAYESDEAGPGFDIFLRPYPNVASRREQVSINGGRYPKWGPAGSGELYYVDPNGAMMAVRLEFSPDLRLSPPVKLFDTSQPAAGISGRPYDVSPVDGRFLIPKTVAQPGGPPVQVSVALNWLDELREQMREP